MQRKPWTSRSRQAGGASWSRRWQQHRQHSPALPSSSSSSSSLTSLAVSSSRSSAIGGRTTDDETRLSASVPPLPHVWWRLALQLILTTDKSIFLSTAISPFNRSFIAACFTNTDHSKCLLPLLKTIVTIIVFTGAHGPKALFTPRPGDKCPVMALALSFSAL